MIFVVINLASKSMAIGSEAEVGVGGLDYAIFELGFEGWWILNNQISSSEMIEQLY